MCKRLVKVITTDSRSTGKAILRRKRCESCKRTFQTVEVPTIKLTKTELFELHLKENDTEAGDEDDVFKDGSYRVYSWASKATGFIVTVETTRKLEEFEKLEFMSLVYGGQEKAERAIRRREVARLRAVSTIERE